MKTKKEILKMSKCELLGYKRTSDLDVKDCSHCSRCSDCSHCSDCIDCSDCFRCSHCSDCFDCSDCFSCRNLFGEEKYQYMICNVQFTQEEYELKIKGLKS